MTEVIDVGGVSYVREITTTERQTNLSIALKQRINLIANLTEQLESAKTDLNTLVDQLDDTLITSLSDDVILLGSAYHPRFIPFAESLLSR